MFRVTGSLQERNGIYQMIVRIPDVFGIYKQKSKSTKIRVNGKNARETHTNRQMAEKMLSDWIVLLETTGCSGSKRELIPAIEEWLEGKKKTIRQDTYEAYLCNYNVHIKPYFKDKKLTLEKVQPRMIYKYVQDKQAAGQTCCSIRKHLVILNGVFKEAVQLGEISQNPCANVTVTNRNEEVFEGKAYDPETAKALLNAVKGDPIEPAVYLGLFLGLRRSEVVGLRWKDIDFDKKLITIQNTVVRFSTISELEKTKSRASRRTLFIPDTLKEYLEALKASQEEARAVIGRKYSEEEHVLQWPDGTSYNPSYVTHRFKKVLKANRLPEIRFHDLRHTAGSILLNDGLSIKQIQNMLGHEKSSTTLDIYSHLSTTGKHETAQAMNRLLS